ncbi:MAG TPA: hypothetical protein VNH18_12855, partial [Bryobacteraceae bacterium]|nr:hypothetical protein [Bryobacteraceae bacterium]
MLAILHRKIVRGLGMLLDRVNINWAESDKPLTHLGHGIEFLHDDLRPNEVVAFIDGFGSWYHGG